MIAGSVTHKRTATVSSTLEELHRHLTDGTTQDMGRVSGRDEHMGRRLHFGGLTMVGRHWLGVRRRGFPVQHEATPAQGQAALWLRDVECLAPRSARDVARQLARLCGDDSVVMIPERSLADAVGVTDAAGRHISYTQVGVKWLTDAGWLRKEVTGRGRGAQTTYYLMPGPLPVEESDVFDRLLNFGAMALEERERLAERLAAYDEEDAAEEVEKVLSPSA